MQTHLNKRIYVQHKSLSSADDKLIDACNSVGPTNGTVKIYIFHELKTFSKLYIGIKNIRKQITLSKHPLEARGEKNCISTVLPSKITILHLKYHLILWYI